MAVCTIKAPESAEGTSTQTRPILLVKYHQLRLGYAKFRDGEYHFDADETTCKAIDEGSLTVSFEVDEDGKLNSILLTDVLAYGDA